MEGCRRFRILAILLAAWSLYAIACFAPAHRPGDGWGSPPGPVAEPGWMALVIGPRVMYLLASEPLGATGPLDRVIVALWSPNVWLVAGSALLALRRPGWALAAGVLAAGLAGCCLTVMAPAAEV